LQETRDKLNELLRDYNLELWKNTPWHTSIISVMT
jgi:hypothetical protein